MSELLQVEQLSMRFGGLLAVDAVSFAVNNGTITALIGPNGAGKTTVFNCITGFYRPTSGRISLTTDAKRIALQKLPGFRIARAGLARTFQNIRLFPTMTALENLMVAQHNTLMRASGYTLGGLFGLPGYRRAEQTAMNFASEWLAHVDLLEHANDPAGSLAYGQQRKLEIARAMCTRPRLLCVDEPAAGLNPRESSELALLLRKIRDQHGVSVLLIEHDMSVVMNISDHIVVLDYGKKIAEGTPAAIRNDPAVIRAYLGDTEDDVGVQETHGAT